MTKRKILLSVLCLICVSACVLFGLTACDTIANIFNNSAPHKHSWSEWTVSEEDEPGYAVTGIATRTCTGKGTCNAAATDKEYTLPSLTSADYTKSDDTATCSAEGKITYTYNKNDVNVSFDKATPINPEAHQVTSWTIDIEATETTSGQKSGQCDLCRENVIKTIPVVGHEHRYGNVLSHNDTHHYYECECGDKTGVTQHVYSGEWKSGADTHWKVCECGQQGGGGAHVESNWIVDKAATTSQEGSKHIECTVCHKVLQIEVIDMLTSTTRTVDFYAINDFHGTVDNISAIGGYLRQQTNSNANTVLLNSGDMFQGSMESNSNFGKLLSDCMDEIGFDAFTYGNHEFDWGLTNLKNLADESSVPFLGANIYKWNASNKTWGEFASDLAQEYVIKDLDNGLKVGIIGVIGKDQITSISSNLVQTIGFKDPLPIIKTLAQKLRNEKNCDVVVVSAHTGPQSLVGETENNEQPSSAAGLEQYVDAVFCAHTHRSQVYTVDGIPFIQGGSNGGNVSYVKLSVSPQGSVSCESQSNIKYNSNWARIDAIDSLISESNAKIASERNQVLTTLNGSLNKNPAIPRLVSRAIAEYAQNQGYDISLAMVNTARTSLSSGPVTYSALYEALPFDNEIYIAKVKGSEIISEVNYGNYYWRSSGEAIESNKYYNIAVIDYLLYHQNSNRTYNYFPSAFTSGFTPVALTNTKYDVYNYRLITRDYLLGNTVNVTDYTDDNNNTDTSLLQSTVTLKYQTVGTWDVVQPTPDTMPVHAGTLADPYDIADALYLAAQSTAASGSSSGYVTGKVSVVGASLKKGTSDDLGGIYLEDDKGNRLLVYYLKKFNGAAAGNNWDWTGVASGSLPNELKAGDTVVIFAQSLFTYNSTTPEAGSGSYCVSINGNSTSGGTAAVANFYLPAANYYYADEY